MTAELIELAWRPAKSVAICAIAIPGWATETLIYTGYESPVFLRNRSDVVAIAPVLIVALAPAAIVVHDPPVLYSTATALPFVTVHPPSVSESIGKKSPALD